MEQLPDDQLMCVLERARENGRNEYPVPAVWELALGRYRV